MDETIGDVLKCLRQELAELNSCHEYQAVAPHLEAMFEYAYRAGLMLARDPDLEYTSEEFIDFPVETRDELMAVVLKFRSYVTRSTSIAESSYHGDEWKQSCQRRSAIEFFKSLYRHTDLTPFLDTAELDDVLRRAGIREGRLPPDHIPVGMPSSHWWWWYPDSAPWNNGRGQTRAPDLS